ncbi:MAG: asparagine synthase C-terminal domain-containing protein, partial [Candidatus Altiarchaeota archaeon]
FKELFTDSVKLRLRSDVPVGSCLSGGLDSSSIVCTIEKIIKDEGKRNFETYSAVYDKNWEKDESEYIEQVIEQTGFKKNYTYPDDKSLLKNLNDFIYAQEEPLGHTSFFAQWMVMKLAHEKNAKVLLDGQGADELLGGYLYLFGYYFYELLRKGRLLKLVNEIIKYYKIHRNPFGILMFLFLLVPKPFQRQISRHVNVGSGITTRNWISKKFIRGYEGKSSFLSDFIDAKSLNEALLNHILYKLEHLLRCEDKSSMAYSIETRLPFLDYRLVDFMFKLPSNRKIDNGATKVILREAMKGVIPETIVNRTSKFGFETREEDWFRKEAFKKLIIDLVDSESFRKRPYYDLPELKIELQEFFKGRKQVSRTIWKWINLELWFRMFIDENKNLNQG